VLKQVFGQLLEVDKTLSTEWEKSLGGEVKMVFEVGLHIHCEHILVLVLILILILIGQHLAPCE
jgi:hypothetical protein